MSSAEIFVTCKRFNARSRPTKSATNGGGRLSENAGRRVVLLEMRADIEQRDSCSHLHRLVDVVRHEDHRLAQLGLETEELVLQARARDGIDRAERLVHEQHGRIGRERAGDTDPLALTPDSCAGYRSRNVAGSSEADGREELVDATVDTPMVPPAEQSGHRRDVAAMVWCGNRPTCWIT